MRWFLLLAIFVGCSKPVPPEVRDLKLATAEMQVIVQAAWINAEESRRVHHAYLARVEVARPYLSLTQANYASMVESQWGPFTLAYDRRNQPRDWRGLDYAQEYEQRTAEIRRSIESLLGSLP